MFLTLKNEKTLKKMRSKTLKNNIFFILGRNLIIRSFEIPHSIWKLHKDFKSVFVFKFRQKTKKFTPKWQKPLFEKRVGRLPVPTMHFFNIDQNTVSPSPLGFEHVGRNFFYRLFRKQLNVCCDKNRQNKAKTLSNIPSQSVFLCQFYGVQRP